MPYTTTELIPPSEAWAVKPVQFICGYNMSLCITSQTRNSADADKTCNTFRGQSRPPNMVPFHMLGMLSY